MRAGLPLIPPVERRTVGVNEDLMQLDSETSARHRWQVSALVRLAAVGLSAAIAVMGVSMPTWPATLPLRVSSSTTCSPCTPNVLTGAQLYGWGFSSPDALALSGGNLFVANGEGSLTELNASTGKLVRVISGSSYRLIGPDALAVSGGTCSSRTRKLCTTL